DRIADQCEVLSPIACPVRHSIGSPRYWAFQECRAKAGSELWRKRALIALPQVARRRRPPRRAQRNIQTCPQTIRADAVHKRGPRPTEKHMPIALEWQVRAFERDARHCRDLRAESRWQPQPLPGN